MDNNGDGRIDCADEGCADFTFCAPRPIPSPIVYVPVPQPSVEPGRRSIRLGISLFVAGGIIGDIGSGALVGIGIGFKQTWPIYVGAGFALAGIGIKIGASILLARGIRLNSPRRVAFDFDSGALVW